MGEAFSHMATHGNDIRGGANDQHVAWKTLISYMRELHDRH